MLSTSNADPALQIDSVGNLAVNAASGGAVKLVTTGTGSGAQLVSSAGMVTATLGALNTTGPVALYVFGNTGASATTGAITAVNVTPVPSPIGSIGTAAQVASLTGPATLVVNGDLSAAGTTSLIGAVSYTQDSLGAAATTVNGKVLVNSTSGPAYGLVALGGTTATAAATGTVAVNATTSTAVGLYAAASSVDGNALVNAGGNVTATGTGAIGVVAFGNTVTISAPTAAITATDTDVGGTDAVGIEAIASDGIAINTGKVTSSGNGLLVFNTVGTSGGIDLTVKGVQAGTDGIVANGAGTGAVAVTATAPVSAAAGTGITATGVDGLVTVTESGVTGTTGGVSASTSGTGAVIVNAAGGTTTASAGNAIIVNSGGAATVNVASGATVGGQGTFDAIGLTSATGSTNTIAVAGTVNAGGTGNAIAAAGGATTINLNSGAAVAGPIQLSLSGATNDVLNVNSGASFTPTLVNFGGGADTLNVRSGGTLNLSATPALVGLETLNNAGTLGLTGTVSLAGVTTFANTGTVVATGGAASLRGLAGFTSNGTISLVDNAANDTLTLGATGTPMAYVGGAGARLALDVDASLGTADRLVVTGNTSGTTVIDVNLLGGQPAVYNPTGIVLVTTSGTTAGGSFTLDPTNAGQGFVTLGLAQSGGTTRLVSTLDASAAGLAQMRVFGADMWYQSFDAYDDAVRGRHAGADDTDQPIGLWGTMYRSRGHFSDAGKSFTTVTGQTYGYSNTMRVDRGGFQLGGEFRGDGFVIGATGGYEWADSRNNPSLIHGEGGNWGVYGLASFGNGLYTGVMYKRDEHNLRFWNPGRGEYASFGKAHSDGFDSEVGLKSEFGGLGVDLQAGLSWVKTRVGAYSAQGLDFDWSDDKSLRGRIGGRVSLPQVAGLFVGAKVYHEFRDDRVFRVYSSGTDIADITMPNRGTWVRLEGGLDSFGVKGLLLNVWGDVGKSKSIGGTVGFRF
jgi:outer membrane autotransporter protein